MTSIRLMMRTTVNLVLADPHHQSITLSIIHYVVTQTKRKEEKKRKKFNMRKTSELNVKEWLPSSYRSV
jgi:hypothetical protein